MIRASLSDRRCNNTMAFSSCQWFINFGCDCRSMRRGLPNASSSSSSISSSSSSMRLNFHSRNIDVASLLQHHRYLSMYSFPNSNNSHRRSVPTYDNKRTMSSKPSYDFSDHDDDDGDDHANSEDESSLLTLLNRSYTPRRTENRSHEELSLLRKINEDLIESSRRQQQLSSRRQFPRGDRSLYQNHQLSHRNVVEDHPDSIAYLLRKESNTGGTSTLDRLKSIVWSIDDPTKHTPIVDDSPSLLDILNDDTKDTAAASVNNNNKQTKYKELYRLQMQLEAESTEEGMLKCLQVWNSARDRSDHETIPAVRRAVDSWYEPLAEAIELEQWLYLNNDYKTCTTTSTGQLVMKEGGEDEDDVSSTSGRIPESTIMEDGGDNDESLSSSSSPDIDDSDVNHDDDTAPHARPRTVKDRSVYGPLLCLLPSRKIAVLLAHTASSISLADKDGESKVVSLAMKIAQVIEMEVNVSRALRVRAAEKKLKAKSFNNNNVLGDGDDNDNDGSSKSNEVEELDEFDLPDKYAYSPSHLQRFLNELSSSGGSTGEQKSLKSVGRVRPGLVRKRCKEILLVEGFDAYGEIDDKELIKQKSMNTFNDWDPVKKVKLGAALIRLLLDHTTFSKPLCAEFGGYAAPEPAFRYLRKKTSSGKIHGCISINPDLFKVAVEQELCGTSRNIPLSMHNNRVQPMVVPPKEWTDLNTGGYETIRVPFMRTRQCKTQKDSLHRADLSKVMEGLNVLGKIPWKINHLVLDIAWKCWENGIALGDIPSRVDYDIPPLPKANDYVDYKTLGDFEKKIQLEAYRKYREGVTKHNRFKQKNMDLHSLRCSAMLKLNQANKYKDFDEIFFPYNVDFRGRAYPVTPHLSIVGSDLCRALLMFSTPKPLGKDGLYWLKVHLANLAGADKMSFDGRAQFAEKNMENIRATINDPLGDNDWWRKFDDPFQGLATCHEIIQAIDSGDPESYMCSLPVHMDGSCNGLQHYAALGRDRHGGKAVNLCVADEPQDVYIGVMHEVIKRVANDANEIIPFDEDKTDLTGAEKDLLKKVKSARLVNGLIDRGVVKRTVMTSVYGVTYIGAKTQIEEKIVEKLEAKGFDVDERESDIHTACGYLASLTMDVMGQQFKGARLTMNWLTECARLIAAQGQPVSFVSPIGVPVVQPYRQRRAFAVVTLLQNVMLTNDSDILPLHRQRQVSAFPPNYVHSLDSSHMILTAVEMQKRGLHFSAVHDSYWTHPCDIEEMNVVLRECFIDLYTRPLLEEVRNKWVVRYPSITFPDIPEQGDLDLNDVRSAPYFFQ